MSKAGVQIFLASHSCFVLKQLAIGVVAMISSVKLNKPWGNPA